MDRRKILKCLSITPFIFNYSLAKSIISQSDDNQKENYSPLVIDPITVITIGVSIVKAFIGLFQSNTQDIYGPYIIEFLKKIDETLVEINKKLDYLISNVDEIKKLVKETPIDVVTELEKNKIIARVADYRGIMNELKLAQYNGNIEKYMKVNNDKVNTLVKQIKTTKSNLRALENSFLVPYIAIGIHIQYTLLNNFLNNPWHTFFDDISNDYDWLQRNMFVKDNCVEGNLNQLKDDRKQLLNKNQTWIAKLWGREEDNCGLCSHILVFPSHINHVIDTSIVKTDDIKILRNIGLLTEDEIPVKFDTASESPIDIVEWTTDKNKAIINYDTQILLTPQTPMNFDQRKNAAYQERKRLINDQNELLQLNYYSIVANASSYYSGLKAIEFCNVYINASKFSK